MKKVNLSVENLLNDLSQTLNISIISGKDGLSRIIKVPEINRMGLTLCGHFSYFPAERIQICGMAEQSYIESLDSQKKLNIFSQILKLFPQIPCIIVTRDIQPVDELITLCQEFSTPLLKTKMHTARFISELSVYLEEKLAPVIKVHGVLVEVYGVGILIFGDSSIGKSECALELLESGHLLVADDVINIKLLPGGMLFGYGEEIIKYHMEVRGIGIIDIPSIFGIGSILDQTQINLVVKLTEWDKIEDYDRVGLEEHKTKILDVEVPEIIIPVRPGRNIAGLIEIAALNQKLKQKGYFAAKQLNERIIKAMMEKINKAS